MANPEMMARYIGADAVNVKPKGKRETTKAAAIQEAFEQGKAQAVTPVVGKIVFAPPMPGRINVRDALKGIVPDELMIGERSVAASTEGCGPSSVGSTPTAHPIVTAPVTNPVTEVTHCPGCRCKRYGSNADKQKAYRQRKAKEGKQDG